MNSNLIILLVATTASTSAMAVSNPAVGGIPVVFILFGLTLLGVAINPGGYDWAMLACAAGFGGFMVWFGSSSGVVLSNVNPDIRSVGRWLRPGWHVVLAYVSGFVVMLGELGGNLPIPS